jgi:hypothetical protein
MRSCHGRPDRGRVRPARRAGEQRGHDHQDPPTDLDGLDTAVGIGFAVCVRGLFRVTGASVPLLRGAPADAVDPG